ncbi:MAG TPA: hypothetical protein VNO30_18065 [Kofleriaceae bacterium]|nr:hypothetical protein [Kofleriaceae bacterium]
MKALAVALLVSLISLASCDGCTRRTPNVCCTSDAECAQLGLPPGSVSDYSCGQGHVCRDFYCVPDMGPDASGPDAAPDAPGRRCDPAAPFGTPTRVPNVSSSVEELDMALTADELTAFFVRFTGTGATLQTSSRSSADSNFPAPMIAPSIAAIESTYDVIRISVTADGLVLYFRVSDSTVYAASRPDASGTFTSATGVFADGSAMIATTPKISADSMTLYWSLPNDKLRAATRTGAYDTFVNRRVVSLHNMTDFAISTDELTLYYSNFPDADIFVSTRASKNVPFDVGAPVSNVSTSDGDVPLSVTADGCLLYIRSNRPGSAGANDYWIARRSQ